MSAIKQDLSDSILRAYVKRTLKTYGVKHEYLEEACDDLLLGIVQSLDEMEGRKN